MPGFDNPPATIDVHDIRVTRIVTVDAPPSAVWSCISEPEHLVHWLGDIAAFPDGLVAGAQGRVAWTGEVVLAARVLEAIPGERLSFEWSEGMLGPNATRVTFALKANDVGTLLHFEESGFHLDGSAAHVRSSLRSLAQGWTVELDELVAYAESRVPA